jgi:hypothetical protein
MSLPAEIRLHIYDLLTQNTCLTEGVTLAEAEKQSGRDEDGWTIHTKRGSHVKKEEFSPNQ